MPMVGIVVGMKGVVTFLFDTGAYFSQINLGALQAAGLQGLLTPADLPFAGKVQLPIHDVHGVLISDTFQFHVLPSANRNMLGLDFLTTARAELAVAPGRTHLWLEQRPRNLIEELRMIAHVEVNGVRLRAS